MQQLARRRLSEVPEVRPEKVAALRQAIQEGGYRIDPGKITAALLSFEDLDLASLMSRHPALIRSM